VFAASVAATINEAHSMSAMGAMPMPGGWTLSTLWLPMCGQSWPVAAASFLRMWVVMMAAMMLPSLGPMLARYRAAVAGPMGVDQPRLEPSHLGWLTALVGAGYFSVWCVLGIAVFCAGVVSTSLLLQWPALARAVPCLGAAVVLIAGALQVSALKARHLLRCRQAPSRMLAADAGTALRYGLHLGLHCIASCAGLTAILLVGGIMDLRVMALVTAAITVERLAPSGGRAARSIGAVVIGAGVVMMARAGGL